MADLLDTDVLLVNRAGVDHSVTKATLMATVQDTDLLLVNRGGVDYKATYADVKKGFGPQHISPAPGDWTFNPAIAGGTGTQADPFIITPETVNVPGGTVQSAQTLTLTGLTPNDLVEWTDHSVGAGSRFHQLLALVPASGQVDLKLNYLDTPASTVGATFTGDLQIGTTYFRWVVTQQVSVAPVIGTVTLADSPEAGRFTSGTFATTVTMTEDGVPASTKGLKAWVEGSLKQAAITSAIASIAGTGATGSTGTVGTVQWKTVRTADTNPPSEDKVYGKLATDQFNDADHPLFQWAKTLNIGGHTDWYIPAKHEMEILYFNLKPGTGTNNTSNGSNPNSVAPYTPNTNFGPGFPNQTTAALFKAGGAEAFATSSYWTASQVASGEAPSNTDRSFPIEFDGGWAYNSGPDWKNNSLNARAIRRVPYTGSEPAIGSAYEGGYFGGLISTAGTGVADYALIVAPNRTGTYGYTGGTDADPYVLTLTDTTGLAQFTAGDAITEVGGGNDATGTVGSVDVTAKTITLGTSSGTWDVGSQVKGPLKTVVKQPNSDVITAVAQEGAAPTTFTLRPYPQLGAGVLSETSISLAGITPQAADQTVTYGTNPTNFASGSNPWLLVDMGTPTFVAPCRPTDDNIDAVCFLSDDGVNFTRYYLGTFPGVTDANPRTITPRPVRYVLYSKLYPSASTVADLRATPTMNAANYALSHVDLGKTTLTFATNKELVDFSAGDAVQQDSVATSSPVLYSSSTGHVLTGTLGTDGYYYSGMLDTVAFTWNTAWDDFWEVKQAGTLVLSLNSSAGNTINLTVTGDATSGNGAYTSTGSSNQVTVTLVFGGPGTAKISYTSDHSYQAGGVTYYFGYAGRFGSFNGAPITDVGLDLPKGTVASTDPTAKTMTLATSSGLWSANTNNYVIGPTKPSSSVRLYTIHDAAGAVSDLQAADPGYVTMTGNSPYTLTFPATLPTGNAPDVDLPAGTTLTTEIQATSTGSTPAVKTSNTVTPA